MQTKLNLIGSVFLAIAGLCSIASHHYISVFFYVAGPVLILAAFLSKDSKDTQIEELHRIATSEIKPEIEAISTEKQEELISLIKDSCESKYNLRNTYRNDKIDSLFANCGARGFTMPEGSVYGGVFNLYINEFQLFSDTVVDAVMEVLNNERFIVPTQPLVLLSQDMIWSKSKEFGALYYKFVDKYPHPMKKLQQPFAFAAFDKEATLLIAKVTAQIKFKGEV